MPSMAFSTPSGAGQRRGVAARAAPPQPPVPRRSAILSAASASLLAGVAPPALADSQVGSYLPSAGVSNFVTFKPDRSKTPALRAGTVDREAPYTFALPPSWAERKVPNIASGNYCQPRCGEPWTEVIFGDDSEGKASLLVSPLVRFTNQKDARIQDIGDPEGFLSSIGPFITGTYLDQDEVLDMKSVVQEDGLTYYYYNVYATYGLNGPHTLTACTVKGDLALLFCVAANDKQWGRSKDKLQTMLKSFRA